MEFISLVIPSTLCKYSTMRRKSFQRFNISSFKGTKQNSLLLHYETTGSFYFSKSPHRTSLNSQKRKFRKLFDNKYGTKGK